MNWVLTFGSEMDILEKMAFKCQQQPLVPLGVLATTGAIILATKSIRKGDRVNTQKYFRYRVGFQLATLIALVAGGYMFQVESPEQKASREEILRAKAKVRERIWIEELERRDAAVKERKKRLEESRAELIQAAKEGFEEEKKLTDAIEKAKENKSTKGQSSTDVSN